MALGIVDLEKAFDTVPRDIDMFVEPTIKYRLRPTSLIANQ